MIKIPIYPLDGETSTDRQRCPTSLRWRSPSFLSSAENIPRLKLSGMSPLKTRPRSKTPVAVPRATRRPVPLPVMTSSSTPTLTSSSTPKRIQLARGNVNQYTSNQTGISVVMIRFRKEIHLNGYIIGVSNVNQTTFVVNR